MKTFIRIILLALVSILGVSCASPQGQRQSRGGPPQMMGGPGVQQGGQWFRMADGTYSHKRVAYNRKTGETRIIDVGDVPNNDPGLLADARENGYRVLQKGESERVSPDQVPEHIRRKIAALPRQGGNNRFGGVQPPRGGRSQGYQPVPPCNSEYCPPQGGGYPPQGRQARPAQYDSLGRIPQYVSDIPSGMKMWDAHQRGYW